MLELLFKDPQTINKILTGMRKLDEADLGWFTEDKVNLAELDFTVENNQLVYLAGANDWKVEDKVNAGFYIGDEPKGMANRLYEAGKLEDNWIKVIEGVRKLKLEKTRQFIHDKKAAVYLGRLG